MLGFERFIAFALIPVVLYVIFYFIDKHNDKETIRNLEKSENPTDADFGQLLYAASAFCGCFDRSPELILNNFLENFTKRLEK